MLWCYSVFEVKVLLSNEFVTQVDFAVCTLPKNRFDFFTHAFLFHTIFDKKSETLTFYRFSLATEAGKCWWLKVIFIGRFYVGIFFLKQFCGLLHNLVQNLRCFLKGVNDLAIFIQSSTQQYKGMCDCQCNSSYLKLKCLHHIQAWLIDLKATISCRSCPFFCAKLKL